MMKMEKKNPKQNKTKQYYVEVGKIQQWIFYEKTEYKEWK